MTSVDGVVLAVPTADTQASRKHADDAVVVFAERGGARASSNAGATMRRRQGSTHLHTAVMREDDETVASSRMLGPGDVRSAEAVAPAAAQASLLQENTTGATMRYVIALDTALRLFRERARPPEGTKLVAPTLLRSQAVSHLYGAARRGEIDRTEARSQLDHMRALDIRLLGDRVLQNVAWTVAERLGWEDTFTAEYVALTKLQADAFVTLDPELARSAAPLVPVASYGDMLGEGSAPPPS